ncbi:MAG: hypothetical protein JNL64_09570 [Blastocatellia bacterium]|nr:hypothetical protein [Blastocatellia bacterium]
MIRISVYSTLFLAAFSTSCGYIFGSGDCGYEARLKKVEGSNSIEMRIHQVRSETVGSVTSCGYSYVHTRAKVEVAGTEMPERTGQNRLTETYVNKSDTGGVDYFYEAPSTFDPRRDVIRIQNKDGYKYASRPETVKEWSGKFLTVALK